ncbi:3-methyl-2-oxobutanoate hydroxymethyltransferase [Dokdonella koreensis]|uniref:3-methyl-2-oxobutanoate hydroxymethyltransferase n=1 Tax=Dokdonella koreensis DS-123 TaxID=1300342 RepID=A0A167H379_9GAMM|nr:3-methyl-2-oxobutanoate hydroxymethyltransferase [Dokdonella koreensis]ANB18692.1 3-methyl-2-oxobutanoate hydroxymethyltransferase [Dokdonella koreensis DS-123]
MYAQPAAPAPRAATTVTRLREMKSRGEKIVSVTAYDAGFGAQADAAGIDMVLVGDSLGMVVQGHPSTLPVTVDQIVYHSACVARGVRQALLVTDLPFMSYRDVPTALASSARVIAEGGAAVVKLEGAGWALEVIRALSERDVAVCAHLGLTPQSVHKLGGYRVQGREAAAAEQLKADALAVEQAGADLLVLECVPSALAAEITGSLRIPTIGIGAGPDCDGQVLVLHDLLGITPGRPPRFAKNFLAGCDSVAAALTAYADAVRSGAFPGPEHGF